MKNYLKLVNFELSRFMRIYLVLAGIVVISQLIGTFRVAKLYMNNFNEMIHVQDYSVDQFLEEVGHISMMNMQYSPWFNLPIVFAAAALIFYCFFIWYRDWFGKNTFIYRLLMLPTARLNIYFSKATAIFLMVLGLVALQVILLLIEGNLLKLLVPANLRIDYSITDITSYQSLSILIPNNFMQFLVHYGIGFMAVFILFTSILFERSFRFVGVLYGFLYAIFAVILFHFPMIIMENILYPIELFVIEVILWAIVIAMSIWISNYLLNKRISV